MFLTITLTGVEPASDLGYLLHKHPTKVQSFEVGSGTATVFYPEVSDETCTAALLLDVDPVALVRGKGGKQDNAFSLGQYVNDRPYAASSLLAVALAKVFRTAMGGRCDARPELAASELPLTAHIPALPCARGGAELATRFFEPLGWQVTATAIPSDPQFPAWGDSRYVDLTLCGTRRLSTLLEQLYVLLPVFDNAKHYWVGPEEVDKLIRAGGDWLADHPERNLITRRYLGHRHRLVGTALERLAESEDATAEELPEATEPPVDADADTDRPVPLAKLRHQAVKAALHEEGAKTVLDLGCGGGKLTAELLVDSTFARVTGVDVSPHALEYAARKLRVDRISERQSSRLELFQSSLTYRDDRLQGFDAAVLMEVVEHLDPPRLPALEDNVFGHARPRTVLVTTPNAEFNKNYGFLQEGTFRHRDHRFEWTRAEFRAWADQVCSTYGYTVRYVDVGELDETLGSPTQMAVFTDARTPEPKESKESKGAAA